MKSRRRKGPKAASTPRPAKNPKAGAQRRRQLATHYAARYRSR